MDQETRTDLILYTRGRESRLKREYRVPTRQKQRGNGKYFDAVGRCLSKWHPLSRIRWNNGERATRNTWSFYEERAASIDVGGEGIERGEKTVKDLLECDHQQMILSSHTLIFRMT